MHSAQLEKVLVFLVFIMETQMRIYAAFLVTRLEHESMLKESAHGRSDFGRTQLDSVCWSSRSHWLESFSHPYQIYKEINIVTLPCSNASIFKFCKSSQ